MKLKKTLMLLMTLAVLLVGAGCSNNDNDNGNGTNDKPDATDTVVPSAPASSPAATTTTP